MTPKATRVLYLDLDGTVRYGFDELGRFVNSADDVKVFPGVPQIMKRYREEGWRIVGVTNQGGVALGHLSRLDMTAAIAATNTQCHERFDLIMACTHHPDAPDPEMAVCWCRKPKYGSVVLACVELSARYQGEIYPPHLALFVGDRQEDADCAGGIGIQFQWAREWRSHPSELLLQVEVVA